MIRLWRVRCQRGQMRDLKQKRQRSKSCSGTSLPVVQKDEPIQTISIKRLNSTWGQKSSSTQAATRGGSFSAGPGAALRSKTEAETRPPLLSSASACPSGLLEWCSTFKNIQNLWHSQMSKCWSQALSEPFEQCLLYPERQEWKGFPLLEGVAPNRPHWRRRHLVIMLKYWWLEPRRLGM